MESPRGSYSGSDRHRGGYPDHSMDWQKAAEAWARSKGKDGKTTA